MKRTEAGCGGRLGHSNMTHWENTEFIKAVMRKKRRTVGKLFILESRWS